MEIQTFIKDQDFLKALDNDTNKSFLVKIEVLNSEENPIKAIEGKVLSNSTVNLNGSSSVRRTCNITFIAEEKDNDLTDVDNLLSANKRIRILEGIKNNINTKYGEWIWFPLGIFVIIQPTITHTPMGCTIQLSCKDKMCLLNGECAGNLPTAVVFSEYDQIVGLKDMGKTIPWYDITLIPNNYTVYQYIETENNKEKIKYATWTKESGWKEYNSQPDIVGETTSVPQRLYDIIQTLVHNFGGIALDKIFINDVPLQIKQLVRYIGTNTLYFKSSTATYTLDQEVVNEDKSRGINDWREFKYNDDVGYVYTDFTFPTKSTLVSGIGDNVCTILDKIKNLLGNYEYFFDIEGNFVFQEIKNYLNNSYDPTITYRLDNGREVVVQDNDLTIIDDTNYRADFSRNTKSIYTFTEGNGLILSFVNTPNYSNIKNDFHIWGELKDNSHPIHYHIAIKEKPKIYEFNTWKVVYLKDEYDQYTGKIRLATDKDIDDVDNNYFPNDWRAELYLRGLDKKRKQQRPDIYEQELLDLFDNIYDFKNKEFKEIVKHTNDLEYFFDYLEPSDINLYDCSVDTLGQKVYSYQEEKIRRLYNTDVPNYIVLDIELESHERERLTEKCYMEGQPYSNIDHRIFSQIAEGTIGYTAQEVARELLYQYTQYNEIINIQSIPIYYLDVNSRITVFDSKSGIHGDYIINSISLPLNAGATMTINASRALERI